MSEFNVYRDGHKMRDEIDRLRAELANVHHNAEMWYAEKLRAEATGDRLRAELAEVERTNHLLMRNAAENWRDKATIARVRGLFAGLWVGYDTAQVFAADVLRALDGGTE